MKVFGLMIRDVGKVDKSTILYQKHMKEVS